MTTTATQVDATNRGWRTFVQGVAIDVVVAIAAVLLVWLPDADVSSTEAWLVLGTSVVKSVLQALAAYVMRLKIAPPDPRPQRASLFDE